MGQEDDYLSEEFFSLAQSAGVSIVVEHQFKRLVSNPKYLLGSGQVEMVKASITGDQAVDVVLINHSLSPAQERNLEQVWCCKVIDRSGLILDIFSQRAKSYEGKLQVELAQLRHLSTRLVRGWTHLERQKGGIGLRGPGETQLETDRRLLSGRIGHIRRRLSRVQSQRHQSRRSRLRAQVPTVALVGYTNAGKSTLFNSLSDAGVMAQDRLFDTLDPSLRQIDLSPLGTVVLADTVGFIQDLPHELIAAFRSTLEETVQASLLLHVVDVANPNYRANISHVNQVLAEIGADSVPKMMVYNKIDLNKLSPYAQYNEDGLVGEVGVSAQAGLGIELLKQSMVKRLTDSLIEARWILAAGQGQLRSKLYSMGAVLAESLNSEGLIVLDIQLARHDYQRMWSIWQDGNPPMLAASDEA